MVIKPRLKGGLALTNHPIGAKEFVKRQIDYIKSQDKYTGPKKVLEYNRFYRSCKKRRNSCKKFHWRCFF